MKKLRIFIDMDGVISDFAKSAEKEAAERGITKLSRPDLCVDYRYLDLIEGAEEAVKYLYDNHEVFIATTPPWDRIQVWADKRAWLEENFPYLKQRLIFTHRKDLLIGDILIDDSHYRGQPDFKGHWFWFNKSWENKNWKACLEFIKILENEEI
tara:strand:+ start:547 stop:1008 length:462 start_codon:yes stop_codon:yes gene_type:complete